MARKTFRRYTNLPSALHLLRNSSLTLRSPERWDDRNDAVFLDEYRKRKNSKTILAVCFAVREETYHHWQVFSRGADGVCIEFDEAKILKALDKTAGILHSYVTYKFLQSVQKMNDVDVESLPFLKRWPYGDEKEYRAIYLSQSDEISAYEVPITIDAIKRITLSPWLDANLVSAVVQTLKSIVGCADLEIYRSTLIDNPRWQKLTGRAVERVVPATAPVVDTNA